jgi:hypothetical protein
MVLGVQWGDFLVVAEPRRAKNKRGAADHLLVLYGAFSCGRQRQSFLQNIVFCRTFVLLDMLSVALCCLLLVQWVYQKDIVRDKEGRAELESSGGFLVFGGGGGPTCSELGIQQLGQISVSRVVRTKKFCLASGKTSKLLTTSCTSVLVLQAEEEL